MTPIAAGEAHATYRHDPYLVPGRARSVLLTREHSSMCGGYCSLREFEAPVICGTAAAKNEAAVEAQEALNLITARPPCSRAPLRYGGELGYVWGLPTGQAAGEEPYEILRAHISWGSGVWRSVKHGVLLQAFLSRDVVCNAADHHKLPQLLPVRPLILLPLQHTGAAWRARRTHRWAVKYDFMNVTMARNLSCPLERDRVLIHACR